MCGLENARGHSKSGNVLSWGVIQWLVSSCCGKLTWREHSSVSSDSHLKVQSSVVGEAWQQEPETAGGIASAVRKQRVANAGIPIISSFSIYTVKVGLPAPDNLI